MERIPHLEALSDKVRNGEPIGFLDAIAVINYQAALKADREAKAKANSCWTQLKQWFANLF